MSDQQLTADTSFGFLDRTTLSPRLHNPLLVDNDGPNTMLKAIRDELYMSRKFVFSIAFVTPSAIALLKQAVLDFTGKGTIITSTYLGFNTPAAFRELRNLDGIDVYIHPDDAGGFHSKGYVFEQDDVTTAIVGSSNLTDSALLRNHEWNLRFSALPDGDVVDQLRRAVSLQKKRALPLTDSWIDEYEAHYVAPKRHSSRLDNSELLPDKSLGAIRPNGMQREALVEIEKVRESGERRAVVISATGTGKTILSALDVRAVSPRRMLFLVHREQILDRAMYEFQRVLDVPSSELGKVVGAQKQLDRRYVFATIQTFARDENLRQIDADLFDYVLVDEVHRAGAATYRKVIEHLKPKFLLGMTATPERTDDFNVFELFDYNVPYEIRLQDALENDMLVPFHYFGVTDFVNAWGEAIDEASALSKLVESERVDHLIRMLITYGHAGVPVRGLIFCSRKDEAALISSQLNTRYVHGKALRTQLLTGDDSMSRREDVVRMLERGDLDYILTVDVFNEGIDIPLVNQVVMLRQTKSSIIFTQQLGRGLRKAQGKEHLIVIDFIGNYQNNYLVPVALFGDNSLSKDSIRKKLIDAQSAGAISGLSSVNFDAISRNRIFASIATSKMDSMQNLKRAVVDLENRLGKVPWLMDFARFDTVDPTVIATRHGNYWRLLGKLKKNQHDLHAAQDAILTFLSTELLNGKRPHELLLLDALLGRGELSLRDFQDLLQERECSFDIATVESVLRIMSLEFFVATERKDRYGDIPIVEIRDGRLMLSAEFKGAWGKGVYFREHVRDLIDTGLFTARHRYGWSDSFVVGERYSRKDSCRLLNWKSNNQSTMYGYKVDLISSTCPIFITYHKDDDVSESTRYEDKFIDESALTWYTRSRRTLQSDEVRKIAENEVQLHLFAKKDDAEGSDFYYLGEAHSSEATQARMPGGGDTTLDVVRMRLDFASPVETRLFEYLVAESTVLST